ncbi:RTA1 like protein-domain-containing protein [Mycotypha africana]|uniref:RTA1 like protein-domain-containing protein n=1 Tax=Mycotypha africana TaxID=64632 RepID=UPI0023011610|nr:RTA1 like protein-domain-containing protein [Mycotypha africana]KAI8992074.1 RTA1 like protein-domain-containing protein [Mycotypha africana]
MSVEDDFRTLRYFHYMPNLPLAIVALVVYAFFSVFLFIRISRSKSRQFLYVLPWTALFEALGYLLRILCRVQGSTLPNYVVMMMCLLLSPNALAMVNYKAVGEIIRLSNVPTDRFYFQPKFVTWFFFSSDIFSFLLQGSGGGLQASGDMKKADIGKMIALVGLAIQLFFFACFALITIYVHRSSKYQYTVIEETNAKNKMIYCLYITIAFLYIRSVYRVVEFGSGWDGAIASAEWAFYVFDTLAIAISFICYCTLFMGNYLPKRDAIPLPIDIRSQSSSICANQLEKGLQQYV